MIVSKIKRNIIEFTKTEDFKIYIWCLVVVLVWRIGLEVINQFMGSAVTSHVKSLSGTEYDTSMLRWTSWDGGWYKSIVEKGYTIINNLQGQESLAFFPGFPIGAWLVYKLTPLNPVYSGLLLNLVLTTFIAFFVYKLTYILSLRNKIPKQKIRNLSKLSVTVVLLSPPSFFLIAFYADALLALGLIGSIYFAYRSKMLTSVVFAALATASKSIGIVAIPALLLISYRESGLKLVQYIKRDFWKLAIYTLIAISGVLLYMIFLQTKFGDPLLFYKVQKYWDGRAVPGFFIVTLINVYYRNILNAGYYGGTLSYFYHLNAMLSPIISSTLATYVLFKDRHKYLWLVPILILSAIIPLSAGGTVTSANRYFLLCIPPLACYFCSGIVPNYRRIEQATPYLLYLSSIGLFILTACFVSSNFAG